jgi:hypothetical protein
MTDISFLIIGAQKAGTTSLFEYMRRHPGIHMPPEKEIAFFATDSAYERGLGWYTERVTRNAPSEATCGTASAGFMTGTPFRDAPLETWDPTSLIRIEPIEDVIPRRIHDALPDVKLLCVLRDPVERALSHYRMAVLDGLESQPFGTAIARLLEPRAMMHARAVATGHNGYIARGEYGRILAGFLRMFPREQLLVLFSNDLAQDTRRVLSSVFGFVGVDPNFVPANLGDRYRSAAVRQRIRGLNLNLWQARLADLRPARALWHRVPTDMRGTITAAASVAAYRVELWNALRDVQGEDMEASVRQELIAHFLPDGEKLSAMLDVDLPWLKTWS